MPVDALMMSAPEPAFAARVFPPEPERPRPAKRRAVFFDVENTSRPEHISRVVDHLALDWSSWRTDLIAVGNWKVIGRDTARLLARYGAHLVHSAPSVGVSDWSDLRIGVAAGVWLAGARPGDVLEIVTNDRAFDAVGDVAASLGIAFRRLSHQAVGGAAPLPELEAAPAAESGSRRRGRGRRRRGWREGPPAPSHAQPAPRPPAPIMPAPSAVADTETSAAHTAPHDEIIAVVHDLMDRAPGRAVTLDALANALKARGFSRTPGSPRLITRLRRIREITVNRAGVITLHPMDAAVPPESAPEETAVVGVENEALPGDEQPPLDSAPKVEPPRPSRRRRSRRGGRRRHAVAAPTA